MLKEEDPPKYERALTLLEEIKEVGYSVLTYILLLAIKVLMLNTYYNLVAAVLINTLYSTKKDQG